MSQEEKTTRQKNIDELTDNEKADLTEEAKKILGTNLYPEIQQALEVLHNFIEDPEVMEKLRERILSEDRE